MKTKAQRRHDVKAALARMQHDMSDAWVDRSIPEGWNFLEVDKPIEPHKTKITMRVDADMLRWFKKNGATLSGPYEPSSAGLLCGDGAGVAKHAFRQERGKRAGASVF